MLVETLYYRLPFRAPSTTPLSARPAIPPATSATFFSPSAAFVTSDTSCPIVGKALEEGPLANEELVELVGLPPDSVFSHPNT